MFNNNLADEDTSDDVINKAANCWLKSRDHYGRVCEEKSSCLQLWHVTRESFDSVSALESVVLSENYDQQAEVSFLFKLR